MVISSDIKIILDFLNPPALKSHNLIVTIPDFFETIIHVY